MELNNNVTMTQHPYDASMDLQKCTTCTNESLNTSYVYTESKDLNKTKMANNTYAVCEDTDNLFWLCPVCHELNENVKPTCIKCGYVKSTNP